MQAITLSLQTPTLASRADILRGSSWVPVPQKSAKTISYISFPLFANVNWSWSADYWRTDRHCWSQSVDQPNNTQARYRVWYSCCTWPKSFVPDKNVGDNGSIISLGLRVCELIEQFVLKVRPFWSFLKSCAEFLKVQSGLPRSEVCFNWSTIFPSLFGRRLWDKNMWRTPKNVCVGGTLLPWGAVSWE